MSAIIGSRNGVLRKGFTEYYVSCITCGMDSVDYWTNMKQAAAVLRDSGWKCIKGKWCCPKCSKRRK